MSIQDLGRADIGKDYVVRSTNYIVYSKNVILSEKTFCLPCFLYLTSNQTGIRLYQENYICNTGLHPFLQPKTWPCSLVYHFRSFTG